VDILRVVTLNIWNNQGPWPERLRLIRRELPTHDAHLVGLQEVLHLDPGNTPDQAQAIADGLGYYTAFASAWHIGGGLQFGNALLSRFPIADARSFMLPCEEGDETRSLLYCAVDAPCGRIPVFVTHLSWQLHRSDVRQQQVAFISARIKELAPVDQDGFPPVLMGDFNAEPDSDEIRYMTGRHSIDGRSVYWNDAWLFAGRDSDGVTWSNRNAYARSALEPDRRIDYVFVDYPLRDGRGVVESCRVVANDERAGVWPSDHFGLLAEIRTDPF